MKAKYLPVILVLIAMTSVVAAENIIIDTRIGNLGGVMMFRVSRIEYPLMNDISGRIIYSVLDGVGITGNINNYRIGLQGVYKTKLMDNKLLLDLAVGGSYASSDEITGSVSIDFGLDAKYKLFDWLWPVVGADVKAYSDSYMADYYGGVSIPIFNWVSLDLLYSAILTNDKHKIGAAGRINLYF